MLAIAEEMHEAYAGHKVGQDDIQDYTGMLCDVMTDLSHVIDKFYEEA